MTKNPNHQVDSLEPDEPFVFSEVEDIPGLKFVAVK